MQHYGGDPDFESAKGQRYNENAEFDYDTLQRYCKEAYEYVCSETSLSSTDVGTPAVQPMCTPVPMPPEVCPQGPKYCGDVCPEPIPYATHHQEMYAQAPRPPSGLAMHGIYQEADRPSSAISCPEDMYDDSSAPTLTPTMSRQGLYQIPGQQQPAYETVMRAPKDTNKKATQRRYCVEDYGKYDGKFGNIARQMQKYREPDFNVCDEETPEEQGSFPSNFIYQTTMMMVERGYVRNFRKANLFILPIPEGKDSRDEKDDFECLYELLESEREKPLVAGEVIVTTAGLNADALCSDWRVLPEKGASTTKRSREKFKQFFRSNLFEALDTARCSQLTNVCIAYTERHNTLWFLRLTVELVKEFLDTRKTGIKRIYWVGPTTSQGFWDIFNEVLIGTEDNKRSDKARELFKFEPIADPFREEELPLTYTVIDYDLKEALEMEREFVKRPHCKGGLCVTDLRMHCVANAKVNRTELFDIVRMKPTDNEFPQLVVRRSNCFKIFVKFQRPFEPYFDYINLVFSIGPEPRTSDGTLEYVTVQERTDKPWKGGYWQAYYEIGQNHRCANITVYTPPDVVVGRWCFAIETRSQHDNLVFGTPDAGVEPGQIKVNRYTHTEPLYVLFNPWDSSAIDVTCAPGGSTDWADEYVLNPWGKIFSGHVGRIEWRPWYFGQFDKNVLDFCMFLLDKTSTPHKLRGDPAQVARGMAEALDSCLRVKYDRDYAKGTAPMAWMGSPEIINAIVDTGGRAVYYAQCYVLAGVFTTLCRALGIGSRCVTGYRCVLDMHAEEKPCNVILHWSSEGELKTRASPASIWVYHVWNEIYTRRPDIANVYDGWQAVDATRRIAFSAEGETVAGPCPLKAIEQKASFIKDASLFYGALCAKLYHIKQTQDRNWLDIQADKERDNGIGIAVITKQMGPLDEHFFQNRWKSCTADYGAKDSGDTETLGIARSAKIYKCGSLSFHLFDDNKGCDLALWKSAKFGVYIRNESDHETEVKVVLTLATIQYTGEQIDTSSVREEGCRLPARSGCEAKIALNKEEVHEFMEGLDEPLLRLGVMIIDKPLEGVDNENVIYEDFRLTKPSILISCPCEVALNKLFYVTCHFRNPWPCAILEDGEWNIQAPGIRKTRRYPAPATRISVPMIASGSTPFTTIITVTYNSKQLRNLFGQCPIQVVDCYKQKFCDFP